MPHSLRKAVALQLDPELREEPGLSVTNQLLVALIMIAAAAAVLETEPVISGGRNLQFRWFEICVGVVFLIEYVARIWIAPDSPRYAASSWPRLRYAVSFAAVVDLVAIVPVLASFAGGESVVLRFLRVLRIIRLAKLGRISRAWNDIVTAVLCRRHELLLTFGVAAILMLISSTLLYWAEGTFNPTSLEVFRGASGGLW